MDVLHAQVQQSQENDDGLLLVPGDIESNRQLVNIVESKHLFEFQGNDRQRIGVVALPGVQNSRNTADIAQLQFIIAILRAARRKNHRVLRELLRKLGVVFSGLHTSVTAGHNKELFDRTGFDGIDDLVCQSHHLIMGKAADNAASLNFIRCRKSLGKRDDLGKVLFAVLISFNMLAAGIAGGTRGKDSAPDLLTSWRDDAVGSKEDGAMEGDKFLKLLPPCIAVVSGKVVVFFESRVIMGRQHLAVGIHIHASTFGLLQKLLQIGQVVTGNQDRRIFSDADIDLGDFRIAEP